MKKLMTWLLGFLCFACSSEVVRVENTVNSPLLRYKTEAEMQLVQSVFENFDVRNWKHQYPAGDAMASVFIKKGYKSKFLYLHEDEDGTKWMRFSLDAHEKGHSPNSKYARTELANQRAWTLNGKHSLSYTFRAWTKNPSVHFTVGQFLMKCTEKPSSLMRIEVENGNITAKIKNYQSDGKTTSDNKTHSCNLGSYRYGEQVLITQEINGRILTIYRDGRLYVTHSFAQSVSESLECYFKAGLYFQGFDTFAVVDIKDLYVF